ncbi:MAG: 50S ribosomal protein L19e [Candidatus Aenigmatarchaeota archaeon]|nr:MAG: 50S ribosomal protein L19e [Candidatus Aenigmarchaeota archaeon]
MNLKNQRRMAATVLDCGNDKVWMDPAHEADIAQAITRADVRRLLLKGYIKRAKVNLQSRGRARVLRQKKLKGRRSGPGSRKGSALAGMTKKRRWIGTIRPLRVRLRELRDIGALKEGSYRHLYRMAKAGAFRSKSHLNLYIKEKGLMNETPSKKVK